MWCFARILVQRSVNVKECRLLINFESLHGILDPFYVELGYGGADPKLASTPVIRGRSASTAPIKKKVKIVPAKSTSPKGLMLTFF
jgi:hypothetical protein